LKRLVLALSCAALLPSAARAALSDEIQVDTDDINAPHEFGLELHVNATPRRPPAAGVPRARPCRTMACA
jgi:hypothetical protein